MHNCQLENVRLLESRRLRSRIRTVGLTPNQTRWKIVVALNVRNKKQKTYFVLDDQALENRQAVIDSRSTSLFHQRLVGLNESIDRIKMEFQQFKERKKKKIERDQKLAYPALITATAFEILVAFGCHGVCCFCFFFFLFWACYIHRRCTTTSDHSRQRVRDDWGDLIK